MPKKIIYIYIYIYINRNSYFVFSCEHIFHYIVFACSSRKIPTRYRHYLQANLSVNVRPEHILKTFGIPRHWTEVLFIFNYALKPFKTYCAIWVRRSNFRHQASPRVSPRDSTQRRKVELWARNVG